MVLVALREERARGGLGLHDGDLILLGDRQNRLGHRRAIGPEHEFDVVLVDQALDELGCAGRCRLIVVVFDRQVIALATDLNAAGLVDLLDGEIVAVLGVGAVRGVDAGGRQGRAEDQILAWLRADHGGYRSNRDNSQCRSVPGGVVWPGWHVASPLGCLETALHLRPTELQVHSSGWTVIRRGRLNPGYCSEAKSRSRIQRCAHAKETRPARLPRCKWGLWCYFFGAVGSLPVMPRPPLPVAA